MVKSVTKSGKGGKMIVWCDKPELTITSDIEPITTVRKPLPTDSKAEKKDKKNKPFLNKKRVLFDIDYLGSQYCIVIPKGYKWNGANIPRLFWRIIGSMESVEFLNASLLHDLICENHYLVDNDRQLSSIIFREMLIASGVDKIKAQTMYKAVDIFQKLFCKW